MNLQGLGKVEDFQKYLDIAFKNGVAQAEIVRKDTTNPNKLFRSKRIELARMEVVGKSLVSSLNFIVRSFPRIDDLDMFYQELIKCTLEYDMLKKSLGAVMWAQKNIAMLLEKYTGQLHRTTRLPLINKLRTEFTGRTSSVLRQIKDNLTYLEYCRKTMKGYPTFKTSVDTIVIAGAPNVGKSTLLLALTGSKPEIASYPFTTKKINLGYNEHGDQFVDTPGLLDRPLKDRNPIERQAILALKHLAKLIVFIIDPTESCGYPLAEQRNLLVEIQRTFDLPVILVSNKADTGATFKGAIAVSAKDGTGIDQLKKAIHAELKKHKKVDGPLSDVTV